jgi:hypothetical protein
LTTEDPTAVTQLAMNKGYSAPFLGYETITSKEGDTLDSIAKLDSNFTQAYARMLVDALNPNVFDKEVYAGQVIRVPKMIPASEEIWKYAQANGDQAWPDLAQDLKFDSQLKHAAEEAYVRLKNANFTAGYDGERTQIEASIDRMYKANSSTQPDPKNFKTIDAQVAGLQGTSYVRELINGYVSKSTSMTPKDIALASIAAADKTEAVRSGRVRIVVLTKSVSNNPMRGLRVFRATPLSAEVNCMQETKIEFDTRSYEASGLLPIARWVVWAEDDAGRRSVPRLIGLLDQTDDGRQFDLTVEWTK